MIWHVVKKQALTFLRNRQHLFLLLAFPLLLITILSTALSGVMGGSEEELAIDIVFVEHEDEQSQMEEWINRQEDMELNAEALSSLMMIERLKNEVFGNIDHISITEITEDEKEEHIHTDMYAAMIEVPKGFTEQMLDYQIKGEGVAPTIQLEKSTTHPLRANIVEEILMQYEEQLKLYSFATGHFIHPDEVRQMAEMITSSRTTVDQLKELSSKEYYTVGMAVMNVLFIASAIGVYAFQEKKLHVFDRIILANISPWTYFIGIFISAFVFSLIQLLFLFSMSWIIFDVAWSNIGGFLAITAALASAIAGVAVLLTAISFRVNSVIIMNFFSSVIVTIFAFFGGSFSPIGDASPLIQSIGDLTPNGASMSAYLAILRGLPMDDVYPHIVYLLIFAFVLVTLAVWSFPKRGNLS